ncbi:MAG: tRNA (guanosine(37)-N1)-methyltransferase TrmD [Candidatus Gracilibacteria bacterium]|nr:tRNA (guanosine(37)-N1)-methyltransferase TrmD [Candidatus Gracilibacteria bacterium]
MKIHIITIFPESFGAYLDSSVIGRAKKNGLIEINLYKLNDFSKDKFKHVDDKAFGTHGQVISPEPLDKAINYIFDKLGKRIPVIYMSPSGKVLSDTKVQIFSKKLYEFIIICGHYEGIDQRIIDLYVDYEVSIGKYVLTSGELASMVLIDALARYIPGVLGNPLSLEEESFSLKLNGKKEFPHYTRPRNFRGLEVPDVLVSGNHKEIDEWKKNNLK